MRTRGTFSVPTLLGGAAALAVAVGLIALLVPALYGRRVAELQRERGWTSTPVATREAKAAQAARLESYGWIDRGNGVVAVPIERAMELVVAESGAGDGEAAR